MNTCLPSDLVGRTGACGRGTGAWAARDIGRTDGRVLAGRGRAGGAGHRSDGWACACEWIASVSSDSQVKSSQVKSSQVKSSQVVSSTIEVECGFDCERVARVLYIYIYIFSVRGRVHRTDRGVTLSIDIEVERSVSTIVRGTARRGIYRITVKPCSRDSPAKTEVAAAGPDTADGADPRLIRDRVASRDAHTRVRVHILMYL